jgi:hypothetical protein
MYSTKTDGKLIQQKNHALFVFNILENSIKVAVIKIDFKHNTSSI